MGRAGRREDGGGGKVGGNGGARGTGGSPGGPSDPWETGDTGGVVFLSLRMEGGLGRESEQEETARSGLMGGPLSEIGRYGS